MITLLFYLRIVNMRDVYTSLFLDTNLLEISLRAQEVSWAFEKKAKAINPQKASEIKPLG